MGTQWPVPSSIPFYLFLVPKPTPYNHVGHCHLSHPSLLGAPLLPVFLGKLRNQSPPLASSASERKVKLTSLVVSSVPEMACGA